MEARGDGQDMVLEAGATTQLRHAKCDRPMLTESQPDGPRALAVRARRGRRQSGAEKGLHDTAAGARTYRAGSGAEVWLRITVVLISGLSDS